MRLRYQPRSIRFLELHEAQGWRLKIYSILHHSKERDPQLIEAAKHTALATLPRSDGATDVYGVGFVSAHQGERYDFVTVACWSYETELRTQAFMRPSSGSYRLEPLASSELSSDVWDLRLLAFERDAWVRHALQPETADLAGYLAARLDEAC